MALDSPPMVDTLPGSPLSAQNSEATTGGSLIYQAVAQDIQQRIRRGDWLPGTRLPSITQLAKDLRVGTSSVREALRSLQSIGLVKIEHGRGVFVTASHPPATLANYFQEASTGLIIALAETRRILEPELAALAAERGTDKDLTKIEELAQQMEVEARHGNDFSELDVQFHRHIAQAARNSILYRTIEGVGDLFLASRKMILMEPKTTARTARYHLFIAEALRSRNAPQARLLMQAHMNDMLTDVLAAEARIHPKETL